MIPVIDDVMGDRARWVSGILWAPYPGSMSKL